MAKPVNVLTIKTAPQKFKLVISRKPQCPVVEATQRSGLEATGVIRKLPKRVLLVLRVM